MAVSTEECEHAFPRFLCLLCKEIDPGVGGAVATVPTIGEQNILMAIAAAEEVRGPPDELVAAHTGFTPHAVMAAEAENRAELEAEPGARKGALRKGTMMDQSSAIVAAKRTQANVLVELAQAARLFHAPDGTGFVDLTINDHRETWPIRSKGFRHWLTRLYYEEEAGAPSSEALQSALNLLEAKARYDAPERRVHTRVGAFGNKLYLDLGDEAWRAVEIDSTGWRVIDNPPARFRRPAGMLPLPVPVAGGSIEALRPFLNVRSETDFVLVVAWALACLRNNGPYPVLALAGEQGSAKSTFTAILRSLLDPNTAPLRALPREDRDLFIAASNSHVLAFDNVSGLPAWISDTLCRLASGGGFAVRQLYTDNDEVLFDASRPVILNGIEEIIDRPDLADRAVLLTLQPIPEERRRPEQELRAAFEAERPRILGSLLDAVVMGLRRLPETHLQKLPRMADFALWATACEVAFWARGTFLSAYSGNLDEVVEGVLEKNPAAVALRAMMETQTVWAGTATELLDALTSLVGERAAKTKDWPKVPNTLSGKLRRAATFLRKVGIDIDFGRDTKRLRTRTITVTRMQAAGAEKQGPGASAASAPSDSTAITGTDNAFSAASAWTQDAHADDVTSRDDQIVRKISLDNNAADGADGADAVHPLESESKEVPVDHWTGRI
ncbi:hypothetical protein [Bradyrhizobium sp. F1.13.3]|uniref:hypothetical protein n=1 Tax=Bradyrhizobium sp. F1.13.3 TaxID=3156351 RepID=UPI003399354A